LLVSNLLLALGLSLLALSQSLGMLLVAYAVLGLGMAAGMFEVAFAAIVHLFGKNSRNALTGVTLVAGFASVAGWTLSVFVEARYGWRGACWFWAAMNVFVAMPLNALLPSAAAASGAKPDSTTPGSAHTKLEPKSPLQQTGHSQVSATQTPMPHASVPATTAEQSPPPAHYAAALLAFVFAASGFISMGMMSHLPKLLEGFGVPLAVAFSVGALVGPAQISGRILDFAFLRKFHPLVGTRIAALAHPTGVLALICLGAPFAALFVILHGLGNGILIISRGTLPLAIFGPQGFGQRQGWLTMPAKFAQAIAPFLFGLALAEWGAGVLWLTCGLALCIFAALCLIRGAARNA
jgi:MFS family permease